MINRFKHTLTIRRLVRARWFLFTIIALALVLSATTVASAREASTADGEARYAKLDGSRIHYQSYGEGRDALVLIHGWGCNLGHRSGLRRPS